MVERKDTKDIKKMLRMIDSCNDSTLLRYLTFIEISKCSDIDIAVGALDYFKNKKNRRVK